MGPLIAFYVESGCLPTSIEISELIQTVIIPFRMSVSVSHRFSSTRI